MASELQLIISKIEGAEHTFAAYAEKEWAAIYGEAPKIEQVADSIIKYVGPALQIAVTAEGGAAAGTAVGTVVSKAQSDLIAASALINDFGATPNAAAVLTTVKANLSTLLTDTGVKSPTAVKAVTNAVNSLDVLTTAVKQAVAASSTPAAGVPE